MPEGDLFPAFYAPRQDARITLTEARLDAVEGSLMTAESRVPLGPTVVSSTAASNGTSTGANGRVPHISPVALGWVRLRYGNWHRATSVEGDGPNTITVRASIEPVSGTRIPVFFGGKRSVVIEPGGDAESDPVYVATPANATFWSWTFVEPRGADGNLIASGKWPAFQCDFDTGGGGEHSNGQTDKTLSGSIGGGGGQFAFGPVAIVADHIEPGNDLPVVAVIGDSILAGVGDAIGRGWWARALRGQVFYQPAAQAGEQAQLFPLLTNSHRRMRQIVGCDSAVVALGTNDLAAGRTSAQVQTDLQTIWALLRSLGVRKILTATVPPSTTSTDGWATTGNQTKVSWDSSRVTLNAWIRGVPSGADGYIEVADAVESARDSGIWKASHTSDGVHPNATAAAAIASSLNVPSIVAALVP